MGFYAIYNFIDPTLLERLRLCFRWTDAGVEDVEIMAITDGNDYA